MEMLCCCSSLPRQEERGCGEGGVDGVWNGCIIKSEVSLMVGIYLASRALLCNVLVT